MCTNFRVKAKDGAVVIGRTMEFGFDLKSKIAVFPRGFKYQGAAPDNKPGYAWTGKYGFVGMNAYDLPMVSDGLNEHGLYVGDLLLPGFAKYQDVPAGEESKAISPLDVAGYLLSNCQTVEDAKTIIQDVYVWPMVVPQLGGVAPLHFAVHDASGNVAVFEYIDGKLNIHDNPVGVLTNSPGFDWHMTNLRNYSNLTPNNTPGLKLSDGPIVPIGQGSGMLGLPGDSTPPSRFIRAMAYSHSVIDIDNVETATNAAYHILNNFDIPKGFARDITPDKPPLYDFTFWSTMADLQQKIYYYRGYDNPKVFRVSLGALNFDGDQIVTLDNSDTSWYQELT